MEKQFKHREETQKKAKTAWSSLKESSSYSTVPSDQTSMRLPKAKVPKSRYKISKGQPETHQRKAHLQHRKTSPKGTRAMTKNDELPYGTLWQTSGASAAQLLIQQPSTALAVQVTKYAGLGSGDLKQTERKRRKPFRF